MAHKIEIQKLNLFYGDFHALINVDMAITQNMITAIIGSSGCGKSTLLRCINRMNDMIEDVKITGSLKVDGTDIYHKKVNFVNYAKR
jgi:phosphate transport system ATP-binding protein